MRPGRLDRILYVSPPDLQSRKDIFRVNFAKMAVHENVAIDELAVMVRFFTHTFEPLLRTAPDRRKDAPAPSSFQFAKTLHSTR